MNKTGGEAGYRDVLSIAEPSRVEQWRYRTHNVINTYTPFIYVCVLYIHPCRFVDLRIYMREFELSSVRYADVKGAAFWSVLCVSMSFYVCMCVRACVLICMQWVTDINIQAHSATRYTGNCTKSRRWQRYIIVSNVSLQPFHARKVAASNRKKIKQTNK